YAQPDEDSCQRWSDHAHVKVLKRLHIPNHARQQISTPVLQQARGCQRFELFIKPDAQACQELEGDVVRNESFQITEHATADPEETYADHRDTQIGDRRME